MQVKSIARSSADSKHLSLLDMIFKSSPSSTKLHKSSKTLAAEIVVSSRKVAHATPSWSEILGEPPKYADGPEAGVFFLTPSVLLSVIRTGIPRASLPLVVDCYPLLASQDSFFSALDVSKRTLHRYSTEGVKGALLSTNQAERVAQLVGMIELAREVLGSKDEAEIWLNSKAVGLGGQRPIELMDTSAGASLVKTLLEQMKYGVYA